MTVWELDSSFGHLLITTGVTGRAAAMGHRLTIAMTSWQATVRWADGKPVSVDLAIDVGSLEVRRGAGGVTALTGVEKSVARSNALKTLDVKHFPQIRFAGDAVEKSDDGYRVSGTLTIRGESRARVVDVRVRDDDDDWRISCDAQVSHADFGIKPYSLMMGALRVRDDVELHFTAHYPKTG